MEHLFGDANLLGLSRPGIGVVGVDDDGGVRDMALREFVAERLKVLEVVVGGGTAALGDIAAQDGVGEGVAFADNFPSAIDEGVGMECGINGVHHH